MPLPIDWPERVRRALPHVAAASEVTSGDLAAQLEAALTTDVSRSRRERLSLLIEYVVASAGESFSETRARDALSCAANTTGGQFQASDIVPGWDPDLRVLFDALAEKAPHLLRDYRRHFEGHALEQIDFALALFGRGDWPESAMVGVARRYLNCPPDTFTYENRIPTQVLSTASRRLLREEAVPLLQWSRIEPMLPDADDELRSLFILNYCAQDFRSKAFQLAAASGPDLIASLRAALDERQLSFSGAISTALLLTRALGGTWSDGIPERVRTALLWDLRCGNDVEASVSLKAYARLPEQHAGELLRECLREERAVALIPAVRDDRVIPDLLARIQDSGQTSRAAIDALIACGPRAIAPLLEACSAKKLNPAVGAVAAEVLGEVKAAEGVEVLVQLLGHSSKRVSGAALRALERMNGDARAALEAGARAPKKTVRNHCERLLAKLGNQAHDEETPLGRVRARAALLDAAAREAFVTLWRDAAQSETHWQTVLRPEVRRLDSLALELLRDWFVERLEEGETRLWCYAVEELRASPEAVWVAVDTFARMPKLSASLWARPRRALGHAGPLLSAPIVHCLKNVHTEYREALYGLLAAHADSVDSSVFLEGLSDPSKTVRTHSVDGLSRMNDAPLDEVAGLLEGSEIGTRVAAAELLAVWGRREVGDQIANAWRNERSAKVKPYLEDALVACGHAALVFSLAEGEELDEDAAERFLCSQQLPKKLPGFIRREQIPELHYASGRRLSPQAVCGFLARLMMLDLSLKGRALRATLPLLRDRDVFDFGLWVYEGWARARNSKHKWAILQLSLTADVDLLHTSFSQIGGFRGTEHSTVNCHLRAAQWHPAREAVQWLGYWSENLSSLGARATAKQLLSRVAFKRRCSVRELRKELVPFLLEERNESSLQAEPPVEYLRQRQVEELERAWLSGRTWSAPALIRLLSSQRYLAGEHLLLRGADGRLAAFVRGSAEAEDGIFDARDEPVASQRLALAHPLDIDDDERAIWNTRLGTGAPFAQLDRAVYDSDGLAQLWGSSVPAEAFAQFRRRQRWFHGEPMDAGIVYTDSLHLLGRELIITLQHSGYGIGNVDFDDDVKLLGAEFHDLDGAAVPHGLLPEVVVSELCLALQQMLQRS